MQEQLTATAPLTTSGILTERMPRPNPLAATPPTMVQTEAIGHLAT
jgi:hypothetical protein